MTDADPTKLFDLADRILASTAPDRDLDGDIAEFALGWKSFTIGADYDGKNASEVLTPTGEPYPGFTYPNRGKIHRAYHVPQFTKDPLEALRFCGLRPDGDYARRLLADALRARAYLATPPKSKGEPS